MSKQTIVSREQTLDATARSSRVRPNPGDKKLAGSVQYSKIAHLVSGSTEGRKHIIA